METRFVPRRGKAHRIGNRLVDAGDAEPARSRAVWFARERDRIADAQTFGGRQLPGDEDCGQLLGLRGGVRNRPPGNRGERGESEHDNQEPSARHS